MTSPIVSVIIPSFNHAKYVDNAVRSVIDQSLSEWELIVIDDGSTDGSPQVLGKYDGDPRIIVVCNSVNRGQSAVINQALRLAKGEFVCFLPSDDWYLPDKLALQVSRFRELDESYGVVYGRGKRFFEDTQATVEMDAPRHAGWVLLDLIKRNFVYPITPLFRRECFDYFPFDETYRAEGEAIYLKLAIKYKFDYVHDFVGVMRDHSSNIGKNTELMLSDNLRYWQEFFSRPDLSIEARGLREWRISRLLRLKGLEYVTLAGRPREGRLLLQESIAMQSGRVIDCQARLGIFLSFFPARWVTSLYSKYKRLLG